MKEKKEICWKQQEKTKKVKNPQKNNYYLYKYVRFDLKIYSLSTSTSTSRQETSLGLSEVIIRRRKQDMAV